MNHPTYRPPFLPLALLVFLVSGCAAPSPFKHDLAFLRQHVITVDGRGRAHDPSSAEGREYNMNEYREQIKQMLIAMRSFFKSHPDRQILVFVHGGMNAPADSLRNADDEMDQVIAAGYYPIYLNWNSDLLNSYGEHVSSITQGQTDHTFGRQMLMPIYVVADLVRAAARLPIVWLNQAADDASAAVGDIAGMPKRAPTTMPADDDAQSERWARGRHGQALAKAYQQLRTARQQERLTRGPAEKREQIRIIIGPDLDVSRSHLAGLIFGYIITTPTKFLSQPFIDWLGTPAWQNMSRRTLMAYDGELGGNINNPDLDPSVVGHREKRAERAVDFSSTGALEVFRDEFQKVVAGRRAESAPSTRPDTGPYHVTLIGHSMGTMVLNEWLRRDLLESKNVTYTNIVYMAAACSVRDFGRAVVPYLLQHPQTQFYNLMLHPLADLRERRRGFDLPPRGSLLVWLDSFLADPQTPLDRTMGRWDNIISATELIPSNIRGQVTLKAFALAPYDDPTPPPGMADYGPQEHGQFRGRPYWCKAFWMSEDPKVSELDCTKSSK